VLVTLATTTSGNHQMTVRLNPDGLGTVQVRIERTASGETQIAVTADKAATLQALQRDQPQLSRALDQAGIPAAGRSMTFHIMEPAQASSSSNETGSGSSHQAPGGRTSADNAGSDGSSGADPGGGGRGSHSTRESNAYSTGRQSNETTGTNAAAAARTYRAGLDITA
jgi:hypothetical protein